MAANIFVTRQVAGHTEGPMAEETPPRERFPGWRYHVTLPAVIVHNEEEEKALPEGYVARHITAEERAAAQASVDEPPPPPRSRR